MQKLILANNKEYQTIDGCILNDITLILDNESDIEVAKEDLSNSENLSIVQFASFENEVFTEFHELVLDNPDTVFHLIEVNEEGKIRATFGAHVKTRIEKMIEELQANQEIQAGAIIELAEIIGGE